MTTMEEQMNCFYLDGSKSASNMLRKCVNDESSPYTFNCGDDPMRQEKKDDIKETARINDISIQRGIIDFNVSGYDNSSIKNSSIKNSSIKNSSIKNSFIPNSGIEGFTNNIFITDNGPGKSSIPKGECPEGFSKCKKTGRCIQKCRGCIYHDNQDGRLS